MREILDRIGVHVQVVPEQELPDGHFPTCPYPNPEIRQVFEKALDMAKETQPDLLLATDPDCDRRRDCRPGQRQIHFDERQ